MDIENHSPFPHIVFEKATTRGRHFDVIVVAGTFSLVHGQPAYPIDEQRPIVCADRYIGAPESTALLEETHLIVGKKNTDVHLLGHAQAPNGEAASHWVMGMRVGPVAKTAELTGRRAWNWSLLRGWHLTPAQPTERVALHSGLAYGGAPRRSNYRGPATDDITDPAAFGAYPDNPVGLGYFGEATLDRSQYYLAAQIQDLKTPITDIGKRYAPVSFGPRKRWHPGRIRHAGTYDKRWQDEDFPYLPPDFDFAYYQSAQSDLIAPGWLVGDEPICLIGCLAQGRLDSALPGIRLLAMLGDDKGLLQPQGLRLDTVNIDLDTCTIQLVWRQAVPKSWGLQSVLIAALPPGPGQSEQPRPVYIHRSELSSASVAQANQSDPPPARG